MALVGIFFKCFLGAGLGGAEGSGVYLGLAWALGGWERGEDRRGPGPAQGVTAWLARLGLGPLPTWLFRQAWAGGRSLCVPVV